MILHCLLCMVKTWRISEIYKLSNDEVEPHKETMEARLYIFDLLDCMALVSAVNRDSLVRRLGLNLIWESGKLRRLIGDEDLRKSLHELIYANETLIK